MAVGLNQVRQLAETLRSELAKGCELALRMEHVAELFDQQLRTFDEVFEQLGYIEGMASVPTAGSEADDLSKLYSMESERKLHIEVVGGEAHADDSQGSEFSDGIELF